MQVNQTNKGIIGKLEEAGFKVETSFDNSCSGSQWYFMVGYERETGTSFGLKECDQISRIRPESWKADCVFRGTDKAIESAAGKFEWIQFSEKYERPAYPEMFHDNDRPGEKANWAYNLLSDVQHICACGDAAQAEKMINDVKLILTGEFERVSDCPELGFCSSVRTLRENNPKVQFPD